MMLPNYVEIFFSQISTDIKKKTSTLGLSVKKLILGSLRGWYPQLQYIKEFICKISTDIKKLAF